MGARVELAATAARFFARLAVHASGRKAAGAAMVASSSAAPLRWACSNGRGQGARLAVHDSGKNAAGAAIVANSSAAPLQCARK